VFQALSGYGVGSKILHRLCQHKPAMLNSLQLGVQRRLAIIAHTVEEHDQLVLGSGRVCAI
jgi:hypothetical protein